jgi:Bromodomain extra-terminal - transcription regulation
VEDEEIELDIDSLDKPVLWKLYLFVKKHTRPPKKAKIDDQGDGTIVGPGTEQIYVSL